MCKRGDPIHDPRCHQNDHRKIIRNSRETGFARFSVPPALFSRSPCSFGSFLAWGILLSQHSPDGGLRGHKKYQTDKNLSALGPSGRPHRNSCLFPSDEFQRRNYNGSPSVELGTLGSLNSGRSTIPRSGNAVRVGALRHGRHRENAKATGINALDDLPDTS